MARALSACLVLLCALTLDARALYAQILGGTVVDSLSLRPRPYVDLEAFDSSGTVRGKTDSAGTFMLVLPHAGAFSLRVEPGPSHRITFSELLVMPDSFVQRVFPIPIGRPYFEFEVDHHAEPRPGSVKLVYPEDLRRDNVEGEVLAQFVVEATGRVRMGSFKVLRSTHVLFSQAVTAGLPVGEFTPATIHGVAVAQLVQQPFTFSLSHN